MYEGLPRSGVETAYRSTVARRPSSARPRRPKAFLLGLCFVACFAIAWSGHLTGSQAVTPAGAAPSAPRYFFGFTPDFGAVDDAALSAYYKRIKRAGARWVRFG